MTINRFAGPQEAHIVQKRLYIGRAVGPHGESLEVRVVNDGRLTPDEEGDLLRRLRESFFKAFKRDAFEAGVVNLPAIAEDEGDPEMTAHA